MSDEKSWGVAPFTVNPGAADPFTIHPKGRTRWALECLMLAGAKGCTPITTPGPRWSDYVFKLRGMGVHIETVHEGHGGAFPGHHARYVLRSEVSRGDARQGRAA